MARARIARKNERKTSAIVLGVILVLAGSIALFWNEWRSAGQIATLRAGEHSIVELSPARVPPLPVDGLVHLAGEARPAQAIGDPLFPVSGRVLRLDRKVEMYQWRERMEGTGGSSSDHQVRYDRVWAEGRIPSERFRERMGHVNPQAPAFASERFTAEDATLGVYGLGPALLDLLPASEALPVPAGGELHADGVALRAFGAYFANADPDRPAIGAIRVSFHAVPAGDITVLGGLDGSIIDAWQAPGGGRIAMAERGILGAEALLRGAYRENSLKTWLIRGAGTLALFVGFSILVSRLVRTMPWLAEIAATSSKRRIAFTAALAWLLGIVALAWLLFRPLMSLGLVAAALVLLAAFHLARRRPAAKPAP